MRALFWIACLTLWLAAPLVRAETPNECGCYRDSTGNCKCTARSKCGCPDDCEPVGCEAKRQRDADRKAAAELKRIAAKEKQKSAAAARDAKKRPKRKPEPAAPAEVKTPEQQAIDEAVNDALSDKPKKAPKGKVDPLAIP